MFCREMDYDAWFKFVDVKFIFDIKIVNTGKDVIPHFCHFKIFHFPVTGKLPAKNFEIRSGLFEGGGRRMDGENPATVFHESI